MDLDTSILNGLKPLTNLSQEATNSVLSLTFENLTNASAIEDEKTTSSLTGLLSSESLKLAYASLCTLILEASKHDASVEELSGVLDEAALPQSFIQTFLAHFGTSKPIIRQSLSAISSLTFPTIVDVKWRLDFVYRTSTIDQVRALH